MNCCPPRPPQRVKRVSQKHPTTTLTTPLTSTPTLLFPPKRKTTPPKGRHTKDNMDTQTRPQSSLLTSPPELTPLEQEVLDEYERLAENMKKVSRLPP